MPRVSATDQMPDFSNWTIGHKKYLLLDKLGSGAYGKVYRALDNSSPAPQPHYVAVKCLLRYPPDSDKDRIQRREIALHKRVSGHPNIVTFYEWFYDGQFVFVVMSLHTGGDLFGAITSKRSYDQQPEKIRATFLQILDAIQHCHDKGVFHRDVKPENIMCSEDGSTVYLGDFGLSTYKTTSREYGCGSSFYMSPGKFLNPRHPSTQLTNPVSPFRVHRASRDGPRSRLLQPSQRHMGSRCNSHQSDHQSESVEAGDNGRCMLCCL